MIAELQVVPSPPGTDARQWAHVDAAIAVLAASGLTFEVGPLGTTIEGAPDGVWSVLRKAHDATLAAGADGVVTVIKLYETREPSAQASIHDLTAPHRPPDDVR